MLIMLTELQFKMIHHFAGMYLFCDFLYYSFCTLSYNKTQIVQERKKYVQRLNIQRCRKDSNTSKAKNSEYNFFRSYYIPAYDCPLCIVQVTALTKLLRNSHVQVTKLTCTALTKLTCTALTKLTCTSDGPYETLEFSQ